MRRRENGNSVAEEESWKSKVGRWIGWRKREAQVG